MSLIERLCLKTKVAFACFVLGKMTSVPSVYFLFADQKDKAITCIIVYVVLIALSIILSYLSLKDEAVNLHMSSYLNKIDSSVEKTLVVKVKDGKIIEVSQ